MKLTYNLTADDVMAFHRFHFTDTGYFKKMHKKSLWWLLLGGMILFWMHAYSDDGIDMKAVLTIIFFAAAMTGSPFLIKRKILQRLQKSTQSPDIKKILGPHEITLEQSGVISKNPFAESKLEWHSFTKWRQNDDYFFLYSTSQSAIIIPKKKLNRSPVEIEEFISRRLHN